MRLGREINTPTILFEYILFYFYIFGYLGFRCHRIVQLPRVHMVVDHITLHHSECRGIMGSFYHVYSVSDPDNICLRDGSRIFRISEKQRHEKANRTRYHR